MADSFDPKNESSWYAGVMTRQAASDILMAERDPGVFLVRDSTTINGDFVLCVREDSRVSHYIINKIQKESQNRYRIGDQEFSDMPSLLNFYKLHYLDTTPLTRPAYLGARQHKVIAKYDFEGTDPEDLPFKKGEILTVVSKDEDQWWTARNSNSQTGSIPVPYVTKYEEGDSVLVGGGAADGKGGVAPSSVTSPDSTDSSAAPFRQRTAINQKLPAFAMVIQDRVPNFYDRTALQLERGDIIQVTKTNMNGNWEGELNGKKGHFPFTHVEFMDDEAAAEQALKDN
uniref:Adapter molecule Crk-like n=1 Tax=Hirondellea gigas TaxID=1518452 RepID=A0A2P2I5K5_9CRUS